MKRDVRFGIAVTTVLTLLLFVYSLKANAATTKDKTTIKFLAPINKAPKNDPFQYKDVTNLSGEIAYSQYGKISSKKSAYFIVVRTIKNGVQSQVISLPVEEFNSSLFDIQLSPNGRYVLFKVGNSGIEDDGSTYQQYNLFYWDLKTKQVFSVPSERLTFRKANWSLSSRYITYCLGNVDSTWLNASPHKSLRLFAYDIQTKQTHFVAHKAEHWIWTSNDELLYSQAEQDHKPKQNQKAQLKPDPPELDNIYLGSATGDKSTLIIKESIPLAVSADGSKILLGTHYDPELPKDERTMLKAYQLISYSHLCIYDIKQQKLLPLKNLGYSADVRFLSDSQLLLSDYSVRYYPLRVSPLTIKQYETTSGQVKQLAILTQKFESASTYGSRFRSFWLSSDKSTFVFQSLVEGKMLPPIRPGYERQEMFVLLNIVSLKTGKSSIICESQFIDNFSFGPIFKSTLTGFSAPATPRR